MSSSPGRSSAATETLDGATGLPEVRTRPRERFRRVRRGGACAEGTSKPPPTQTALKTLLGPHLPLAVGGAARARRALASRAPDAAAPRLVLRSTFERSRSKYADAAEGRPAPPVGSPAGWPKRTGRHQTGSEVLSPWPQGLQRRITSLTSASNRRAHSRAYCQAGLRARGGCRLSGTRGTRKDRRGLVGPPIYGRWLGRSSGRSWVTGVHPERNPVWKRRANKERCARLPRDHLE